MPENTGSSDRGDVVVQTTGAPDHVATYKGVGQVAIAHSSNTKATEKIRWAQLQVLINAQDYICDFHVRGMSARERGILISLLAYTCDGKPFSVKLMARLANVSDRVMRSSWPKIRPLYEDCGDGTYRLICPAWCRFKSLPTERVPLEHLRPRLMVAWDHACCYCGLQSPRLEIEHIVPLSRGGSNDIRNLAMACATCNIRKGRKTATEFGYPTVAATAERINQHWRGAN